MLTASGSRGAAFILPRATIRRRSGATPSFGAPFDGLIDNVFIFNGLLSNARIDAIRAGGQAAILRPTAE